MAGWCRPVSLASSYLSNWCISGAFIVEIRYNQSSLAAQSINIFECGLLHSSSHFYDCTDYLGDFCICVFRRIY